jgi:hypothetical protein
MLLADRRAATRPRPHAPSARAITICCTSSVPSPIVRIFALGELAHRPADQLVLGGEVEVHRDILSVR